MNYAKVVGAALQLFPKRINITVINEISGAPIGNYKIALSQLPEAFDRPTIWGIDGHAWRVVGANPVKADEFSVSKKLILHVLERPQWTDERLQFTIPTRHAYHPLMTHIPLYNDFILHVKEDGWRQLEFLPASSLTHIQDDMSQIEPILTGGSLWGYNNCYLREQTGDLPLNISITDFCHLTQAQKKGAIRMYGNAFVQNGLAIDTANHTYYGIFSGDRILSLSLAAFDCIDDEFMQVVTAYNLVLADWCTCRVVMTGLPEAGEQLHSPGTQDWDIV